MRLFYEKTFRAFTAKFSCLVLCLLITVGVSGQTTLAAGDLAFTGYLGDGNPDSYSVVLLKDIEANTVIFFTDYGWRTDQSFRTGEGLAEITFTMALGCGTEVILGPGTSVVARGSTVGTAVLSNSGPNLASGGDQIFAFQGTVASPTLIAGIQMNGGWDANATNTNTSSLPTALTDGTNALAISPEVDNAVYNCTEVGSDVDAVRAAVNNSTNWTTMDTPGLSLGNCSFTSCSTAASAPPIAFTMFQADSPEEFAFVTLQNFSSGDNIMFTDNGWLADDSGFRPGEGTLNLVFSCDVGCGAEVYVQVGTGAVTVDGQMVGSVAGTGGSFALANGGDQIIAYYDTDSGPMPIAALDYTSNGWDTDATTSSTSALPAGLVNGESAISTDVHRDNGDYDCSTVTGTASEIATAVNTIGNWDLDNDPINTTAGCSFDITGCGDGFVDCPVLSDPTDLCLGDIAITGYQASTPDKWGFVLLKDVGAGTIIMFTDHGWYAEGGFRSTEGEATVTFSRAAACGTELVVDAGALLDVSDVSYGTVATGGLALSGSGDQLFAYQGDLPTANDMSGFLAALQMNGDWDATASSSNTSARPCIFEDGVTSMAISPEVDNAVYENCDASTNGATPSAIRAHIYDQANWSTSGSAGLAMPEGCTIACEACVMPEIEVATATPVGNCPDDPITLEVSGVLGDATEWAWYADCCSGTPFATGETVDVFPTENTTYYVRGVGGCVDVSKCDAVEVVALIDDEKPSFNGTCGDLDQSVSATTGECGTNVYLPAPTATDNCDESVQIRGRYRSIVDGDPGSWSSWSADPSGYFAVGVYEIQWRARDDSGNNRRCKHDLIVTDDEDPTLECIDITIEFNGETFQTFYIDDIATYSDNCGIADTITSTSFVSCAQIDEVIPVQVTVTDVNGGSSSCTAYVTVDGLPCGWMTDGHVDCEGEADYTAATETFILSSEDCSNAITSDSDEYAFIQRTLCGNASITAEVTDISGSSNGWAGVTFRESNDPGSKMVTWSTNGASNHRREVRSTTGGNVTSQQLPAFNRHWVRLVRTGNSFRGYASSNGISWFLRFSRTVSMNQCVEVGLVVNAYVGSGDVTAMFENVSITGSGGQGLQGVDSPDNESLDAVRNGTNLQPEVSSSTAPKSFTVYPNPSFGEVQLSIGEYAEQTAIVNVLDGYGKVVKTQNLGRIEFATANLDLRQLPAGVYTIQLQLEDGTVNTQRVVLQPRP